MLGSFAITLGKRDLMPGTGTLQVGHAAPGIMAAGLCLLNMLFVARYLKESRDFSDQPQAGEKSANFDVRRSGASSHIRASLRLDSSGSMQ